MIVTEDFATIILINSYVYGWCIASMVHISQYKYFKIESQLSQLSTRSKKTT